MADELLLTDKEIRDIVARWYPVSPDSLEFAYGNDMKEVLRDFGFHIAAKQLSKAKSMSAKKLGKLSFLLDKEGEKEGERI